MQKSDEPVYYKLDMAGVCATPSVSFSRHVGSSFSWQLHYCGVPGSPQLCSLLSDLPPSLCSASVVESLFARLLSCNPCIGNSDQGFLTLRSLNHGVFRDVTSESCTLISISKIDLSSYCFLFLLGKSMVASVETKIHSTPSIRQSRCALLNNTSTERCKECTSYRGTLRAWCSKQARQTTPRSDPSSCVNYRYLSETELRERLRATHKLQQNTQKKLERLKGKVAQSV